MPGPALYGYLTWTWVMRRNRDDTPTANQNPWKTPDQWGNDRVTNTGGGVVRSLIKEGQPFYRCGQVESINGLAWAPLAMSTDPPVGRVTVIYGKTRPGSTAPWLYGWAVYSHQVRTGLNPDGSYAWGPRHYHVH